MMSTKPITNEIIDQAPPHDCEVESWVLGSAIINPAILDDLGFLTAADFHNPDLSRLYRAMSEMHAAGQPIDVGLLRKHFDGPDWAAKIGEVAGSVPTAAHAVAYARTVARLAKLRHLRNIALDTLRGIHGDGSDPEDILESAEAALAGIRMADTDGEPVPMSAAAAAAVCHVDEILRRGTAAGVPTGIPTFDNDQGGLFPGELIILAARPGVGKTSLGLQIAVHNARRGRLVYFASCEMSAVELSTRLACSESGVSNRLVRTGQLDSADAERLNEAFARQAEDRLDIHDAPGLTVASIRREIRKRAKDGLALAVVDYLQLIRPEDRRLPREQQVAGIVRALKETSREYRIPVLCLSQLNRMVADDEIPQLGHLRESGAIEQDADMVLFIAKHEPAEGEPHNAILSVAKNRNGETGPLRLNWNAGRTRFDCPQYQEFARWAE